MRLSLATVGLYYLLSPPRDMFSSVTSSVRQRASTPAKRSTSKVAAKGQVDNDNRPLSVGGPKAAGDSQWSYQIAFVIVTALAFATRFYGLGHPNQVVFDEVHFGKVRFPLSRLSEAGCATFGPLLTVLALLSSLHMYVLPERCNRGSATKTALLHCQRSLAPATAATTLGFSSVTPAY